MYCPKRGDSLREQGGVFLCERGRMELSQFMADRLYSGFVTQTEQPEEFTFTKEGYRFGGQWFRLASGRKTSRVNRCRRRCFPRSARSNQSEVNNGAFPQYFVNGSAESTSFAVGALEKVGAPKTARICERAIHDAFPTGLPQSVDAIRSTAASFSDETLAALEPFNEEFFSYPRNLTDLLFAFVSEHPDEFGALPKGATMHKRSALPTVDIAITPSLGGK
jgi:hypothetical protein